MVPPKVWKLLKTVGCEDIYGFLGVERDAPLEELRAAAEKKYEVIHNQSARSEGARAGADLAGLCKSAIFRSVQTRTEYDDEAARRAGDRRGDPDGERPVTVEERQRAAAVAANAAAASVATAAVEGARSASASAVRYVGEYRRSISATGAVLVVAGIALAVGVSAPAGAIVLGVGTAAFSCGFVAVLYRRSREWIVRVGGVGLVLVLLGIMGEGYSVAAIAEGGANPVVLTLVGGSRVLGGLVLVCSVASFGLKEAWHVKLAEAARPAVEWWQARIGAENPAIVLGGTGLAVAGVMAIAVGPAAGIVFGPGGAGLVEAAVATVAFYSVVLVGGGFVWRLGKGYVGAAERGGDTLRCGGCGTRSARSKCRDGGGFRVTYRCPVCGARMEG